MKTRHVFGSSGKPDRFYLEGKCGSWEECTREEYEAACPSQPIGDGSGLIGWKPLASDALKVHPKQIAKAREDAEKKGVPTDFMPDGRPVFRSRQHRASYMKAYGFFDRNAGYGDAADGSFRGDRPDPVDPVKELSEAIGMRISDKGREAMVKEILGVR